MIYAVECFRQVQKYHECNFRCIHSLQCLLESSCRLVESSRRVVLLDVLSRCNITRLFFNSSYYLSTRRVAFQLFVQRSRALFLGPKGPGYHN